MTPNWLCDPCGLQANYQYCMKKYGREPLIPKSGLSTYHIGTCDACETELMEVTEWRDYYYAPIDGRRNYRKAYLERLYPHPKS